MNKTKEKKRKLSKKKKREIQKRLLCGTLVALTMVSLVAGAISVII